MAKDKNDTTNEVHIVTVERGKAKFHILGTTPMLHNCLSSKARQELLLPSGRKTDADKKSTLKHSPLDEFKSSIYFNNKAGPTLVQHLTSAFRGAMRSAALDLPGVSKAEIGRLMWVEGERVDIYGVPQIDMRIVRQAGMNRTPDVRSRCIMAEWACSITVSFTMPQLRVQSVANLLAAAGMYIGVGDGRNEKGAFSFGSFAIVDENDADYLRIVANGGRAVQEAAMENPESYNEETDELLTWFNGAVKTHRSFAPLVPSKKNGKSKTASTEVLES
jgi:hypothetical protein